MFLDLIDHVSNLNWVEIKAGHFPDEYIPDFDITLTVQMSLHLRLPNHVSGIVTLAANGEVCHLLALLYFGGHVKLLLLTVGFNHCEPHTRSRTNLVVK